MYKVRIGTARVCVHNVAVIPWVEWVTLALSFDCCAVFFFSTCCSTGRKSFLIYSATGTAAVPSQKYQYRTRRYRQRQNFVILLNLVCLKVYGISEPMSSCYPNSQYKLSIRSTVRITRHVVGEIRFPVKKTKFRTKFRQVPGTRYRISGVPA